MDVESRLRRHLAAGGAQLAPAPRDVAERTRLRHRQQRRHRAAVAGVALAVALVFCTTPALRGVLPDGTRSAAADPATTAGPLPSLYDLPVGGSLADDEDWPAAMAAGDR
jgi:ferric-dicitrate binding protein FerR (iron transport regulator)